MNVYTRFCDLRDTVVKYMNSTLLVLCLCEKGLSVEFLEDQYCGRNGPTAVVTKLVELGPKVMPEFLEALEDEDQHLGHECILSLLRGRPYAEKKKLSASSRIRKKINSKVIKKEIMLGLQLQPPLISHLMKQKLLTKDEVSVLENCTAQERNSTLLELLETKGPTAHLLFVECLKNEETHITHKELFSLICCSEEKQVLNASSSKSGYKRGASRCYSDVSVTKRLPDRLRIDGKLDKDEYFDVIQKVRLHHLRGEWGAVDKIVMECSGKRQEFYVAVLLESCTGFITQQLGDRVEKTVKQARQLCTQITNNCCVYLRGRCEWTLAKLYRYSKQFSKALYHIRMARQIQSNVTAGEDTALVNYCYGCILLETLATTKKFDPEMQREAQRSLELAIAHASSGDYGLDLSHPKIRLAQLYIGSSPHSSGTCKDPERLKKAHSSLKSVNLGKLAPRTMCIYYYTESDLHKARNNTKDALYSAQKALSIANENNFTEEIYLVRKRISNLSVLSSTN